MTETRQAVALNSIAHSFQELQIAADAFGEALTLLQKIAAGEAGEADASHFLMEMERRTLAKPGYYSIRQRFADILQRDEPAGRFSEVKWEKVKDFREILLQIVEEHPEKVKQALVQPGYRRWFVGQMMRLSPRANMNLEAVTALIETTFKEASR